MFGFLEKCIVSFYNISRNVRLGRPEQGSNNIHQWFFILFFLKLTSFLSSDSLEMRPPLQGLAAAPGVAAGHFSIAFCRCVFLMLRICLMFGYMYCFKLILNIGVISCGVLPMFSMATCFPSNTNVCVLLWSVVLYSFNAFVCLQLV